jgi:hypothetical protein
MDDSQYAAKTTADAAPKFSPSGVKIVRSSLDLPFGAVLRRVRRAAGMPQELLGL